MKVKLKDVVRRRKDGVFFKAYEGFDLCKSFLPALQLLIDFFKSYLNGLETVCLNKHIIPLKVESTCGGIGRR